MAENRRSGKLAVILHADVAGSTELVQQDEHLAHERIQESFRRLGDTIAKYHGHVRELRGDALLAEFERASDAVTAALAFQADQHEHTSTLSDPIRPTIRAGIAMGEVVIADDTITGAGVVLAQRLEQLAEPGGVVIQSAAYETIPGRFPFEYEDLGEHEVKGFDKPVRAYSARLKSDTGIPPPEQTDHRLRSPTFAFASIAIIVAGIALMWFKPWEVRDEPASAENMAFPLPDKPSIAILPFTNMSDDAQQEYFVDGMTEDLITDLSKLSGLFVIARNSVFTYKGKPVKVSQVAEELGVRYVLEGSVRRAGDQVRINAQLVDATTGGHLWAERYDGTLENVFAIQDEVTQKIASALAVQLTAGEHADRTQLETDKPEAYEAFLKGWQHYLRRSPEHYAKAREYFETAIELDPNYARASAALAFIYHKCLRESWYPALGLDRDTCRSRAQEYFDAAKIKPTSLAHQVGAYLHLWRGKYEQALEEAKQAVSVNPNDADSHVALAEILIYSGDPQTALEPLATAGRLDPHNKSYHDYLLGMAQFGLEQFDAAAASLERSIELNPDLWQRREEFDPQFCRPCVLLVAAYAYLGQKQKADALAQKLVTEEGLIRTTVRQLIWYWPFQQTNDVERLENGLRKAGIPDVF